MDSNNPNFEIVYQEDECGVGNIDDCKEFLNDPTELKLFHMNVGGIFSKHNELAIHFNYLPEFDCIFLTETHTNKDSNLETVNFPGYQIYGTKNHSRKTDGVVILVNKNLNHSVEEINIQDCNCLKILLEKNSKKYNCLGIYRSPSGKISRFLADLKEILKNHYSDPPNPKSINIIKGDININLVKNKSKMVNEYLNLLTEFGFMSLINKPTRVKGTNKPSCLDHIFVGPKPSDSYKSFILQSKISDHYSTILKFNKSHPNVSRQESTNKYFQTNILNTENLYKNVESQNWGDIFIENNPETSTSLFINKLQSIIDENTTKKTIKIDKKRTPWITNGLINSIKKRDKLHLLCAKQPMNKRLLEFYRKYRNKLNSLICKQKREHLKNEIQKANNDKKKFGP